MMEEAVQQALKAGMDDAVARLVTRRERQVKFHRSDISVIKTWEERRLHMFMAKDRRVFSLVLENPDEQDVVRAVQQGRSLVPVISPREHYHGLGQPARGYQSQKRFDPRVDDERRLRSLVSRAIDEARDYVPEVAGVAYAGVDEVQLASSQGVRAEDANSWVTLSVRAFAADNASGHAVACARDTASLSPGVGEEAGQRAVDALRPRPVERGTYDVVFTPLAFANLVASLSRLASAFFVDSGMSMLAGKLDHRVGSQALTVTDSGVHPEGIGSRTFDDEGMPTQETTLIEKGVLASYLHNTSTAHRHHTTTTGNAGILYPTPWNAVVAPGDLRPEELIGSVKRGLLVTNMWYTRFQNYVTGDFSTIARDGTFFIENGSVQHPVEGVRISDNLLRIMQNVALLSAAVTQIAWWEVDIPVFTPAAMVKNVSVTRSFL
ncbi:MAG TPA: TldD/PmbA family protein [Thermoplasmatales archaeon]|nr:TldD/PmbA family protein [Thermoplasmatales archaeon]